MTRNMMMMVIFVGMFLLLTSVRAAAGNEQLFGTWRLVSFTQTVVASSETTDVFGKAPRGFINYGRDGRMSVLIVKDERLKPADLSSMTDRDRAELFTTMVAYGGTYNFDGKAVTHHIEISWNQVWTGTDQVRYVKFDSGRVILSTAPEPRPQDGKIAISVLTWEKWE